MAGPPTVVPGTEAGPLLMLRGEAGLAAMVLEEEPDRVKPDSRWAKVT